MQIDIRNKNDLRIRSILFSGGEDTEMAESDARELYLSGNCTEIRSEDSFVMIDSKEDALNLIKALQKAIELGNWDE